jgi:hypothetical protein
MKLENFNGLEPRLLGRIGVDAGIIWIGDPCYVLHADPQPKSIGKDWFGFCDALGNDYSKSFNFDLGHEGLGVCASTRWGDGVYNVIGFFEPEENRPEFVVVDFTGAFSHMLHKEDTQ